MDSFDVVVIGGGPGGYTAAIRCSQSGKKTALVEREHLGGVCLNWGCIPTKTLLENARMASNIKNIGEYGICFNQSEIKIDYAAAYQRSRKVSERLAKGVSYLMKKNNITVFWDLARIADKNTVELERSGKKLSAENIILAMGASPSAIPGIDHSDANILDSKKALQLEQVPKSVVIIGAGAIGVEFASIWNAYGAKVTIVEMRNRILPLEDADVSANIAESFAAKGIKIIASAKIETAKKANSGLQVIISTSSSPDKTVIPCEKLLISAGVDPNTADMGLEELGIQNERGFIQTDEQMRTAVAGIYAIGDITGKLALAHTASAQGIIAAETIAGIQTRPIKYQNVPKCIYCIPEAASVGLTEEQAKKMGIDVKTAIFPYSANGKALASKYNDGFIKMLADKNTGEILGVHMAGEHVTELISQASLLIGLESTDEELAKIIYPHPTLSEMFAEAAHILTGNPMNI